MKKAGVFAISFLFVISLFFLASAIERPDDIDPAMIKVMDKEMIREEVKEQVKEQYIEVREEIIDEAERKLKEQQRIEKAGGIINKEHYLNRNGEMIKLRIEERIESEEVERRIKTHLKNGEEIEVKTRLRLKEKGEELTVELKDGSEKEIKILPDRASKTAREQFRTRNIEVELKEIEHKNIPKVVYHIETEKTGKFIGIFKMKLRMDGQIDSETGELIEKRKPWWAFLVTGEESPEEDFVEE